MDEKRGLAKPAGAIQTHIILYVSFQKYFGYLTAEQRVVYILCYLLLFIKRIIGDSVPSYSLCRLTPPATTTSSSTPDDLSQSAVDGFSIKDINILLLLP